MSTWLKNYWKIPAKAGQQSVIIYFDRVEVEFIGIETARTKTHKLAHPKPTHVIN